MKRKHPAGITRVIAASSVGTMIEWYDFYIFGSLAGIISTQFFPKENPTAAFLATLAAFGVGFVIRPFGAVVFGRLGDVVGRKHTFLITLLLMGGSTCAIGLIPSYRHIGILAPVLVFVLRALQGMALGGEYGGAATYVAEHAPDGKKGFYTSFIQTTATFGLIVSLLIILLCKSVMSEAEFIDWGWRLPFLFSVFLVGISFFIRRRMDESPEFKELQAEGNVSKNPLKESFANWSNLKWVLLALFGATAGQGVVWYTGQFYAMNFCTNTLHIDASQIQKMLIVVLLIATPMFVLFAWLSDLFSRKWIMLAGILCGAVFYIPVYRQMSSLADWKSWQQQEQVTPVITTGGHLHSGDSLVIKKYRFANAALYTEKTEFPLPEGLSKPRVSQQLILSESHIRQMGFFIFLQLVFVAMAYGPIAAFLVELFPVKIRYTSMSLPYHIGNGVFGGLTPLIAESLVLESGDIFAGLYYPVSIAALTFIIGAIFIKRNNGYTAGIS